MEKKLQSNIWKYALFLIANKRIFVAILGAYFLTIPDVTPQGIGIILLAGSAASFILEIPSGYISDKIGHKQALIFSRILILLSTTLLLFAENIFFLILGSIFMSAGAAFLSGTGSAFMHETLQGLKREHDYTRVMGKISSVGFAMPIVLMVLTPFLVSISFKAPFALSLVIDLIGLIAAISLVTPPVSPKHIEEIGVTNFRQVVQEGLRLNFFAFALFSGIVGGLLFTVGGFRAPYQMFLGIPVIWYGVFLGIGRALASLMLAYSGKIKERFTIYSFYKLQIILYAALIFILGIISLWWVIVPVFIIINAFHWGLSWVDEGYLVDIIRTSKFKATLLSVNAQFNAIVAGISGFGIGFIIERLSYQHGFLYLGFGLLGMLTLLYFYLARTRNINVV